MKQQTMLVNENRLNLADARARQYLARQMEKHFFGDGADAVQGYVPQRLIARMPERIEWREDGGRRQPLQPALWRPLPQ